MRRGLVSRFRFHALRYMSGHSKWSTIKHKKALTDAKRGKLFSKISRMLSVAVKEKGASPETNLALRLALEKAKEANMPSENVQRIIKKYSGGEGERLEEVQFEGYGPGGIALIIDAITDSRNRTSQEMRHLLSSHGGTLASPGSVLWMFDCKGEIVMRVDGKSREEAELAAIEAGAEDVFDQNEAVAVLTKPDKLARVRAELERRGYSVEKAGLDWHPKQLLPLADPAAQKHIEALFEALDDNDDVQEVYSNVNFST